MKKITVLSFLALLVVSFFLTSDYIHNLFGYGTLDNLYYPLAWSLAFVPLSLLALSLTNQNYKEWLIFTSVFFPVSMVVVFLLPVYGSGIVSIDRELGNWFFGIAYSCISIIYFIVQFVKNRQKSA